MKKYTFFFVTLLFAGSTLFMSCSKKSDNQPPTIHLLTGAGLISSDVTVNSGAQLTFGISASATSGKLNKFLIQRIYHGKTSSAYDTTFSSATYSVTIGSHATGSAGTETWTFTIFDDNGTNDAISLAITTTANITYGQISTYTSTILGSYQNFTVGSSFASSNGTVYSMINAKANDTLIDWLYYYGDVNHATIAAPDDSVADNVIFIGADGPSTWSHRNATVFNKVSLPIDWNLIQNDSIILIGTQSGVTATNVTSLAVNDVVAFITELGKKGLMKVTAINSGASGTITYDVKVQKTGK